MSGSLRTRMPLRRREHRQKRDEAVGHATHGCPLSLTLARSSLCALSLLSFSAPLCPLCHAHTTIQLICRPLESQRRLSAAACSLARHQSLLCVLLSSLHSIPFHSFTHTFTHTLIHSFIHSSHLLLNHLSIDHSSLHSFGCLSPLCRPSLTESPLACPASSHVQELIFPPLSSLPILLPLFARVLSQTRLLLATWPLDRLPGWAIL